MSPAARANAATLEVTAGPIRGRDGFDVNVTVRLPVRLHDGPLDRAAFAKGVGEGRVVSESVEKIVKLIADPVQAAIASAAEGTADDLLAATDAYAAAAAEAARLPLFKLGLMPDGPATATADAPALRQRQAEQAAAAAARAADDRADDLLRRFEDIRRQSPDVPPGRLLMALPPEDRRNALLKLFEASESQPRKLLLAAGVLLFELDPPRRLRAAPDLIDVDQEQDVGTYRCIRRIEIGAALNLAIGARDGVILTSTGHVTLDRDYAKGKILRSPESRRFGHAFSSVTIAPAAAGTHDVWASHRELGLQVWQGTRWDGQKSVIATEADLRAALQQTLTSDQPLPLDYEASSTPTWVSALSPWKGGHHSGVLTCVTDKAARSALLVARCDADSENGSKIRFDLLSALDAPLVELLPLNDHRSVGVSAGGRLLRIDRLDGGGKVSLGTDLAIPLIAAAAVPWLGDVRVAACVEDGPVVVAGPDDDVRVEYRSEHRGFAAVAASGGRLAAVTGDRQRVVVWNLHEPERPILDLYALADTRSRVADVAFL